VLLDAGLGPRQLAERLASAGVDPASLDAVFISHEHGDHVRGAAAFSTKWGVPLAGTRGTFRAAGFAAWNLPAWVAISPGEPLAFRRLGVRAVTVLTTPPPPSPSSSAGAPPATADLGHLAAVSSMLPGCDALVESNYDPAMLRDGPYPWSLKERILGPFGHLSNGDVGRLLEKGLSGAWRLVVLAHLSQKNNHPELALQVAEEALDRGGRRGVQLTLAPPEGTGWIAVRATGAAVGRREGQLRLF
jgi:phosphoribosyl 1,2-cyclic phosphodiesterase